MGKGGCGATCHHKYTTAATRLTNATAISATPIGELSPGVVGEAVACAGFKAELERVDSCGIDVLCRCCDAAKNGRVCGIK